ncbi:MAG: DUF58 domain-containing protein [Bacteroidales bacterium]|nr:DUF58 domain-containing protein [Bacteroidales bacterium]MDX9925959.1 DUF58 domain-containing protein [Bacteroidales bacterium]HOC47415.1 DUF58 domain-containing protein [Bacteroidales bacterium]HPS96701.1 DUF58 domain-containing protein [Bacteroidales bacterium]
METTELLKKVRKIEIRSRGLTRQIFAGEYHSAFRGRGMAFSEVREYQFGDDIRNIDWNVTARFGHPYVKVFEEERELTVMLLVDVSRSGDFGTVASTKREMMTEIAAVLAYSVIANNDKVGLMLFSDRVEKYIPPKKGRGHMLRIIREMLGYEPSGSATSLSEPLRYLTNIIRKRCTAFILSDFLAPPFTDALRIASGKHDVVALRISDRREKEMPDVGFIKVLNPETGREQWIDTSSSAVRKDYAAQWKRHDEAVASAFVSCGVDMASISTGEDYIKPLISLFKHR